MMESIQTHPTSAAQAKTFIAPGSLSFPSGAGELTPPSEGGVPNGQRNGQLNGQKVLATNGNGVTPATPVATPGATQSVSGIVPTLQYVFPRSAEPSVIWEAHMDCKEISLPRSISIAAWT